MRINLTTPFAEKDAVKALGARWDAAKKCWYIVDVADLTPFARWMPNADAVTDSPDRTQPAVKQKFSPPKTSLVAVKDVADCGCDVLPWEDCVHTVRA